MIGSFAVRSPIFSGFNCDKIVLIRSPIFTKGTAARQPPFNIYFLDFSKTFIPLLRDLIRCLFRAGLEELAHMAVDDASDLLDVVLGCRLILADNTLDQPSSYRSSAVIFMTFAASLALLASFHRIEAKPSGERIE